jgi:peroxiredoxin
MLASGCFSSYAADYSPRVGLLHHDFTLPNIADNEPISLSQYRGRKVLLIHFASW